MGRIDYKSGMIFAAATIPGAILGAVLTAYVPRHAFDIFFGIVMIGGGIFLWLSTRDDNPIDGRRQTQRSEGESATPLIVRDFIDAEGMRYHYAYNPAVGSAISVIVGFVSSLLGVGGGFIHVPALTRLLNFPVHIATATSQFVLAIMALTGTLVHVANGVFSHGLRRTAILSVGVILGAQLGAHWSNRIGAKAIIQGLAIALVFVGVRLILSEI
jgi:uncharacterized protein